MCIRDRDLLNIDEAFNVLFIDANNDWLKSIPAALVDDLINRYTVFVYSSDELPEDSRFQMCIRDRGNSVSDTSSNEITIDTSVAAPSLALAHDLGGSSTDLLTSDGTINVAGLGVGATVQYSMDGGNSWLSGNGGAAATATTGSFVASAGSYGAGSCLLYTSRCV